MVYQCKEIIIVSLSFFLSLRCTALYGVPTMFIDMLNCGSFGKVDLSTLYTGVMAGSPCPIEVMRKVVDVLHMSEVTVSLSFVVDVGFVVI
jgi:acyl-CoA synthetase (AMP-forming)/AMP-acid ligase II